MRLRSLVCFVGWILCTIFLCGSALGSGEVHYAAVHVSAVDADSAKLIPTLTQALDAAGVQAQSQRLRRIEPARVMRAMEVDPRAVAQLWLDALDPKQTTLYLTTPSPPRVFARRFSFDDGFDPVALELLGVVAQSSIEAILAGRELGMRREEFEKTLLVASAGKVEPARKRSQAESRTADSRPGRWRLSVVYEAELLNASSIQQGPGLELAVNVPRISLGISAQMRVPTEIGNDDVTAQLTSRSLRAFATLPLQTTSSVSVAAGAALGLDWIEVEPRAERAAVTPSAPFSATDSVLRVFGALSRRWGVLEIGALLGCELGLVPARYFLLRSSERVVVFVPWRVRPLSSVALSLPF